VFEDEERSVDFDKLEKATHHKEEKKPAKDVRPSDYLLGFYLRHVASRSNLGAQLAAKVVDGGIDLYKRLNPRDTVDSIYCLAIIAKLNMVMKLFDESTWISKDRAEHLHAARQEMHLLMELLTARENRSALLGDRKGREEALEKLWQRYGLAGRFVDE